MRAELRERLTARPFKPFRIVTTDQRTYDIRHPDQAAVTNSSVTLPAEGLPGAEGEFITIALIHIIRLEPLPADS